MWRTRDDQYWRGLRRREGGAAAERQPGERGAEPGTVCGARSSQVGTRPSEGFLFFSFVYPFNKYILSICCVPGTILCAEIQRGEQNELLWSLRSRRVG